MDIRNYRPRILHIDDEEDFLELFHLTFNKYFNINSVSNVIDAIEKIKSNRIDAIITDYDMPEMNGLELLRRLKKVKPDVPVILQTGQGNEEVAREAFLLGASDYFTKDFFSFAHKEKLVNSIKRAIEIRRTTEEKRISQEKYHTYIENAPESVFVYSIDGIIIEVNKAATRLTGYTKKELLGMSLNQLRDPEDQNEGNKRLKILNEKGRVSGDGIILRKDGSRAYISINAVKLSSNHFISFCKDITDLKLIEQQKSLSVKVLEILNQPGESLVIINKILSLIKKDLSLDAVGLRLKEGEDYPYYYTNGFTCEFAESERYLCSRDEKGEIIRDSEGIPVLECMCGKVIRGRTEPSLPFFTAGGSFWTNSTSKLLASTNEEDRQGRTRNLCNREGYESVALVPLKSEDEIIGLLQFNDKGSDRFTIEMIEFFEGLGASIGIALSRIRAEEEIRDLSKFPSENPSPVIRVCPDGTIMYGNPAGSQLFEIWNRKIGDKLPDHLMKIMSEMKNTDTPTTYEVTCRDRIFSFLFTPIREHGYINIYGRDITESKRTRQALIESEEKFRELAELLPQTVYEMDLKGNLTYSNRFGFEYSGYSEEDLKDGINVFQLIIPEEHQKIRENISKALSGIDVKGQEYTLLRKDGEKLPVMIYGCPIVRNKENVGFRGIVVDMTQQKQLENRLRKERDRAQQYLDLAAVMMVAIDKNGTVNLINKRGVEILGYDEDYIVGKNWFENFLPERLRKEVGTVFKKLISGDIEPVEYFENPVLTSEGTEKIIAWHNTLLRDDKDNIIGTLSSGEDITERKIAESALKESESKLRSIFNGAPVGIGLVDNNRIIKQVNRYFCEMTGYSREEIVGKHSRFLYPTDEEFNFTEKEKERQIWENRTESLEGRLLRKDGKIIDVFFGISPIEPDNVSKGITFTVIDITEQKAALEKVRRSKAKFRSLAENTPDVIVRFDKEIRHVYANPLVLKFTGISPETHIGKTFRDLNFPEEFCNFWENQIKKVFETGTPFEDEFTIQTYKGLLICNSRLIPERDKEGNIISVMSVARDITREREAESKLKSIFRAAPVGIGLVDENRVIKQANNKLCEILGYSADEIVGMDARDLYNTEEEYQYVGKEKYRQIKEKGTGSLETRLLRKDGKLIDVLLSSTPLDPADRSKGVTFTVVDITEQKAVLEEIRRSEEKFRSLAENMPDVVVRFNKECRHIYANPYVFKVTGVRPEDHIGKTHREIGLPEYFSSFWEEQVGRVFKTGIPFEDEYKMEVKDGIKMFNSRLIPERDREGNIISVMCVARDITREWESERDYRLLFNEMTAGFAIHRIVCDKNNNPSDYVFLDVNPSFERLIGIQKDKIIGKTVREIYPEIEDHWIETYGKVALTGKSVKFENYFSELKKYFEITAFSPGPGLFACVVQDITDRKDAENQIRKSLEEKEILMREIHHRVKNNLQIMISLLDMQSCTTDNNEIISFMQTCSNRLNSMALIHQKLYLPDEQVDVDIRRYIRDLAGNLIQSYNTENFTPEIELNIKDIYLKIDQAIPCGLILNELITNCLKHAFKGKARGKIIISINLIKNGNIEMIVRDNGVGIMKGITLDDIKTIGLKLVNLMVYQLNGNINIRRNRGTIISIEFPVR